VTSARQLKAAVRCCAVLLWRRGHWSMGMAAEVAPALDNRLEPWLLISKVSSLNCSESVQKSRTKSAANESTSERAIEIEARVDKRIHNKMDRIKEVRVPGCVTARELPCNTAPALPAYRLSSRPQILHLLPTVLLNLSFCPRNPLTLTRPQNVDAGG
jgi:hypothetical protein